MQDYMQNVSDLVLDMVMGLESDTTFLPRQARGPAEKGCRAPLRSLSNFGSRFSSQRSGRKFERLCKVESGLIGSTVGNSNENLGSSISKKNYMVGSLIEQLTPLGTQRPLIVAPPGVTNLGKEIGAGACIRSVSVKTANRYGNLLAAAKVISFSDSKLPLISSFRRLKTCGFLRR